MNAIERNYPGSRWWKFDFHTHTNVSDDGFKKSHYSDEVWLKAFMAAQIDCVAITDHNSGDGITGLQSAYAAMKERADAGEPPDGFRPLFLFPGVEISVNGGIHLLAIFDPSKNRDDVRDLLTAVDYQGTHGKSDGVTRKAFLEVVNIIVARGGLAIPAHVDEELGLFQVYPSGQTLLAILNEERILAMELRNKNFELPNLYQLSNTAWTPVLGTDTHNLQDSGDSRYPGSHFTWVKMGTPKLEGLRLALIDGSPLSILRSDDYSDDPNAYAENIIESIRITNARYVGVESSLAIALNPWLNTLVGGRGTGKSTVIEFLRIALRRENDLPKSMQADFANFNRVARNRNDEGALRNDTHLEVRFRKQNSLFKIQWNPGGDAQALEEWNGDEWVNSPGEVRQRFPVRIFSQKELFAISAESDALLRVIDQSPEVDYVRWEAEHQEEENRYLSAKAKLRELEGRLQQRSRIEGELADVKQKLRVFEEQAHADTLKRYQRSVRQQRALEHFQEEAAKTIDDLRNWSREFGPPEIDPSIFQDDESGPEIIESIEAVKAAFTQGATQMGSLLDNLAGQLETHKRKIAESRWARHAEEVRESYQNLVNSLKEKGVEDPSQYGKLVQQREKLEKEISRLNAVKDSIQSQRNIIKQSLDQLRSQRLDISRKRTSFLNNILEGNLIVTVQIWTCGKEPTFVESQLRALLGCEGDRFSDDILSTDGTRGVLADLYSELPENPATASNFVMERLDVLKRKLLDAAEGKEVEGLGGKFRNFLNRTSNETRDRIESWYPEDYLEVSYSHSADGMNFRPIRSGSPGQRTAAILAFLLSYGDEPLILDQPEDDLDNYLIYDLIVQQLRENKRRRQIVVVTHNPNIVVNGDAELVVAMDFSKGQCRVKEFGSLQDASVREEICRVMEGGRKAFNERYRRLGKEQSHV